jgi:hypothetical protein
MASQDLPDLAPEKYDICKDLRLETLAIYSRTHKVGSGCDMV